MPNVYRYAYSKLGNKDEAEDVTSETFLAFIQSYTKVNDPHAWLIGTCRNIIYKKFRDRPKIQEVELIESDISSDKAMDDEVIDEQLLNEIKSGLQKLDEVTREIITLKIWEDLKFNEIAEIMSVSENTIKAKYYRGLKELAEKHVKVRSVSLPLLLLALPKLASASEFVPQASFNTLLTTQLSQINLLTSSNMMQRILAKLSSLPIAAKIIIAAVSVSCLVGIILLFVYINQPNNPGGNGNQSSTTSSVASSTTTPEPEVPEHIAYMTRPNYDTNQLWIVKSDGTGNEMIYSEKAQLNHISNVEWKRKGELSFIEQTTVKTGNNYATTSVVKTYNVETKAIVNEVTLSGNIRDFKWAPNKVDYAYSITTDETYTMPGSNYPSNPINFHSVKGGVDKKLVTAGVIIGNDRQYPVGFEIEFNADGSQVMFGDYGSSNYVNGGTPSMYELFPLYLVDTNTNAGKWVSDTSYKGNQTLKFLNFKDSKLIYEDLERKAVYSYDFGSEKIEVLGEATNAVRAQALGVNRLLVNSDETVTGVGVTDTLSEFANGSIRQITGNYKGVGYLANGDILAQQTKPYWLAQGQIQEFSLVEKLVSIKADNTASVVVEIPKADADLEWLNFAVETVIEPK